MKLCSQNLQVLKLDGNYLNAGFLRMLLSTLKQQVAPSESLQVLSMSDCGIKENTEEENINGTCPAKAVNDIIELFSSSLISIDLSYNELGPNFTQ